MSKDSIYGCNTESLFKSASKVGVAPYQWGIWGIYGEDPNCDWGGPHSEPFLGNFEGTFTDAVEYALALPSFVQWGSGGHIKRAASGTKGAAIKDPRRAAKERLKQAQAEASAAEVELKRLEREELSLTEVRVALEPVVKKLTTEQRQHAARVLKELLAETF